MRRRIFPLVLTAVAAVLAFVRRSRRRRPPAAPRYVAQPSAPVLAAPEPDDDVALDGRAGDSGPMPDPQVEGESLQHEDESGPSAIHNATVTDGGRAEDDEASAAPTPEPGADAVPPATPSADSPFRSVAWTPLGGEPAPSATELRIGFSLVAGRESLARVDVRETASQVFVTVLARRAEPQGARPAYAEAHKATVALSAPLGDRALVHAPPEEPGR